jgi:hypothetical protein
MSQSTLKAELRGLASKFNPRAAALPKALRWRPNAAI